MKIILICFGVWIFKSCFSLISENPAGSLWLVPVVFLVGFAVAFFVFKLISNSIFTR